jgi:transposase
MPQAEGRSRPWRDHRRVVEGIVFRYRTGVAWRDLPERFGPWQTVSSDKNSRCCRDEPGDHALGRTRGGLSTKIHAAVDGRGRPLVILLTQGQAGDAPMMLPLLAGLRVGRPLGRPRTRPDRVLADKAYSSRAIRTHLRARGIGSVIPEPDDQKAPRRRRGSSGGRPVSYDKNAYRGRNVIERAFNGFKHWRGLATRYDKHAVVYRGGLVLAAALIWLAY